MNRKLIVSAILIFFVVSLLAISMVHAERPTYVYDRANVLDSATVNTINNYCASIDKNSTDEIVVVTLKNLDNYGGDINKARVTIFNDEQLSGVKGIGKAGKDNGVLLVVSIAPSHSGIEVGYGLEGNLTDSKCGRILDNNVMPNLKSGNYSGAVISGVMAIGSVISGTSTSTTSTSDNTGMYIVIAIIVAIIVCAIIVGALGGFDGDGEGGGISGGSSGGFGGGFGGGGSGGGGAGRISKFDYANKKVVIKLG